MSVNSKSSLSPIDTDKQMQQISNTANESIKKIFDSAFKDTLAKFEKHTTELPTDLRHELQKGISRAFSIGTIDSIKDIVTETQEQTIKGQKSVQKDVCELKDAVVKIAEQNCIESMRAIFKDGQTETIRQLDSILISSNTRSTNSIKEMMTEYTNKDDKYHHTLIEKSRQHNKELVETQKLQNSVNGHIDRLDQLSQDTYKCLQLCFERIQRITRYGVIGLLAIILLQIAIGYLLYIK